MNRAALYLRSTKDRSDVSIDVQRRQLRELAETRKIIIVKEYADVVESAKDEYRPAFQEMITATKNTNRGWDTILILDTSRLARRKHIGIFFEEYDCRRNGITLIYKSVPDADPITEMMIKSMMQMQDEYLSLTSKAKGLAGMAENVHQGFRAGGSAPKGYKLEAVATGAVREGVAVTKSKLVPNDDAMLVRAYLQHRAKGKPRSEALRLINKQWPATTLLSMERNAKTYAGHTVWNKQAEKSPGGGYVGGSKWRDEKEWVINQNTHEPLINENEAAAILAQIKEKKHTRTRSGSHVYLLSGILQDSSGQAWHGNGDGFYRLGKGKKVSAANIESAIVNGIKEDITGQAFVNEILRYYKELSKPVETDKTAAKIKDRISELDSKAFKLSELLLETTAHATLMRSIEKIESDRDQLQTQLDEWILQENDRKVFRNLKATDVQKFMQGIANQLDVDNNRLSLKSSLQSIIDKITLDQTTMLATITYKIESVTGDKVASPRGSELNPRFARQSFVLVPHQKRA